MKYISLITALSILVLGSCKKALDIPPESFLSSATFYSNAVEMQQGLNAAYSQLQKTVSSEWQFTELRSDNSKMGNPGSQNNFNRDLTDLDIFIPAPVQDGRASAPRALAPAGGKAGRSTVRRRACAAAARSPRSAARPGAPTTRGTRSAGRPNRTTPGRTAR